MSESLSNLSLPKTCLGVSLPSYGYFKDCSPAGKSGYNSQVSLSLSTYPFRLELEVFVMQGMSFRKTGRIAESMLPELWTWIIARKRCKKALEWLTSIPALWTWWYVRRGKTFLTPSRWKRWVTRAICPIHSVLSLCFSRKKGSPKGPPLSPTSWSSQTAARWSQMSRHSRCIRSPHSMSPLGWLSWKQGRWGAGLLL